MQGLSMFALAQSLQGSIQYHQPFDLEGVFVQILLVAVIFGVSFLPQIIPSETKR